MGAVVTTIESTASLVLDICALVGMLWIPPQLQNQTVDAIQSHINRHLRPATQGFVTGEVDELLLSQDEQEAPRLLEEAGGAESRALKAEQDLKDAESMLKSGIAPIVWPTKEEFEDAQARFQYSPDHLHFAITGVAGSGKSSLINAFRGLSSKVSGAAETGFNETTKTTARYSHPDKDSPLARVVWYDIPGAGTISTPGWQYFNTQGLFIFDFIIVAPGDRFTQQDVEILEDCERYKIPSFLVRSKADMYIDNIIKENAENDDEEEGTAGAGEDEVKSAREQYIQETRLSFKDELGKANLDCNKRIFLVSNNILRNYVKSLEKGCNPKTMLKSIDEGELIKELLLTAKMRRYPREYGSGWVEAKVRGAAATMKDAAVTMKDAAKGKAVTVFNAASNNLWPGV